jgi:hypothetical protein
LTLRVLVTFEISRVGLIGGLEQQPRLLRRNADLGSRFVLQLMYRPDNRSTAETFKPEPSDVVVDDSSSTTNERMSVPTEFVFVVISFLIIPSASPRPKFPPLIPFILIISA